MNNLNNSNCIRGNKEEQTHEQHSNERKCLFQTTCNEILKTRGEFLNNFFASLNSVMVATNWAPNFDYEDFLVRKSTRIYQMSIST